jgi:hypothetical protein
VGSAEGVRRWNPASQYGAQFTLATSREQALGAAIEAMPDRRCHAVVIDEGQDFEVRWFGLLQRLLVDPGDVFCVFHDPGQALIRADVVADLGLERHELFENRRNPESIAALAGRFYRGGEEVSALRETGRRHTVITAEPGTRRSRRCARRSTGSSRTSASRPGGSPRSRA